MRAGGVERPGVRVRHERVGGSKGGRARECEEWEQGVKRRRISSPGGVPPGGMEERVEDRENKRDKMRKKERERERGERERQQPIV